MLLSGVLLREAGRIPSAALSAQSRSILYQNHDKAQGDSGIGEAKASNESGRSSSKTRAKTGLVNRRRTGTRRTAFSDSESDDEKELFAEELAKLLAEKEELLKSKHKEIEKMQDKVLRSYADMENMMDRARRETENSKKFAIQLIRFYDSDIIAEFCKKLMRCCGNLGRASSVVKDSFSKLEVKDADGYVPLLKTFLEEVEMTEKQLSEVFKKYGVEKYDPTNEPFDPHRHNAVFKMPDSSKPPGTVAAVLKAGYTLHDRVNSPCGVTQAAEND